jgi:hypothetical protein
MTTKAPQATTIVYTATRVPGVLPACVASTPVGTQLAIHRQAVAATLLAGGCSSCRVATHKTDRQLALLSNPAVQLGSRHVSTVTLRAHAADCCCALSNSNILQGVHRQPTCISVQQAHTCADSYHPMIRSRMYIPINVRQCCPCHLTGATRAGAHTTADLGTVIAHPEPPTASTCAHPPPPVPDGVIQNIHQEIHQDTQPPEAQWQTAQQLHARLRAGCCLAASSMLLPRVEQPLAWVHDTAANTQLWYTTASSPTASCNSLNPTSAGNQAVHLRRP